MKDQFCCQQSFLRNHTRVSDTCSAKRRACTSSSLYRLSLKLCTSGIDSTKQKEHCLKSDRALLLQYASHLGFSTCMRAQNQSNKPDPILGYAMSTRFGTLYRSVRIQVCETPQCNQATE